MKYYDSWEEDVVHIMEEKLKEKDEEEEEEDDDELTVEEEIKIRKRYFL